MNYFYKLFPVSNVILIVILLVIVILDYITGLVDAYINNNISSKTGYVGVLKKLSYFVIVIVSAVISYIIDIDIISVTTLWLIVNDIISILENIKDIKVPIPEFLEKIIKKLKVSKESKDNE